MRLAWILPVLLMAPQWASAGTFSDLPDSHPLAATVEDLRIRGLIQGYPDGTFRPEQSVNRAEALKLVVAPISLREDLTALSQSSYIDVPNTTWFFPYVQRAFQTFGIIDGPPITTRFHPERTVNKAEFLKMMLLANNIDLQDYDDVREPLSADVQDPDEWFYPYIRFALSAGMISVDAEERFDLAQTLTRGDVATILSAFLAYREKSNTQSLVEHVEEELLTAITTLQAKDKEEALRAAARARLRAYGVHRHRSTDPFAQGLVKIAEGFAEIAQEHPEEAFTLAEAAHALHHDLSPIAAELMDLARAMLPLESPRP